MGSREEQDINNGLTNQYLPLTPSLPSSKFPLKNKSPLKPLLFQRLRKNKLNKFPIQSSNNFNLQIYLKALFESDLKI